MSNQNVLNKRYEFVYLFDVKDGNPNGDPDAGNLPRIDPETGHGLVTDVCIKRKVRNYVEITAHNNDGMQIFVHEGAVLNTLINDAHDVANKDADKKADKTKNAKAEMCRRYYDVRTFGAVMSTGKNAGQVRGPIQLTFSRSIDPIVTSEHTITRMAVTEAKEGGTNQTMGRKATVPYGLYRCHGFISAHLATDTGFSVSDLELFWEALKNMFDHDHSAARGLMAPRKLIVFEHSTALGNAPAHKLLEAVKVERNEGVTTPRSFEDYSVKYDADAIPEGVTVKELIELQK